MDYEQSETGNWNVAENWSVQMIFKPFFEASQYLTLAKFGCSDIEEDFIFDEQTKIRTRIKSLNWAKEKIEFGIRQSLFAIKNSTDKTKMINFLNEITDLDDKIKNVETKTIDHDTYKISINEEMFNLIYKVLTRIFTEVTEPMNKNDLIFNHRETFDPKKAKKRIKDDFIITG